MADHPAGASTSSLEQAVVRRLGHLRHGELGDRTVIDRDASFFAATGFYVGDDVLDSLDIVEMVVALELDFNVDIVTAHDVSQYDSIAKLSRLLAQIAGPNERAVFESHWAEGTGIGIADVHSNAPL